MKKRGGLIPSNDKKGENMKKIILALSVVGISSALYAQSTVQNNNPYNPYNPNQPSNVYNQNPTTQGSLNNQQPGYFGPAVYPNWNPGNPGMYDDQDQIFKDNNK
jgi:hypothetical protein